MPDHERLRDPNAMHIAIDKTQTRMGLALMSVVSRIIIDNRSLAVTAPLLSRARQQAVFGPRARLSQD